MSDDDSASVLLRCEDLVVGYNGTPLLPPMTVALRRGRFLTVLGRNGSGKSTWFKTLLGQVPPIAGTIWRSPTLRHVAYVPQSDELDPILPLRACDVVMQGRLHCNNFLRPFPSRADREASRRALADAGVEQLANHDLTSLSRGQRQRVMFARMLATEADLALLDEPTAAMDLVAERDAMDLLARLAREHGIAVVMISHAHDVADRHADDVLLLDRAASEVVFGPRQEVLGSEIYRRHLAAGDDDAS